MNFEIEEYKITISKYDERIMEVNIDFNNEPITGTFTVNILKLSERIKSIISKHELAKFGYIRFDMDFSKSNIFEFSLTKDAIKKVLDMKGISKDYLEQCKQTSQKYKK